MLDRLVLTCGREDERELLKAVEHAHENINGNAVVARCSSINAKFSGFLWHPSPAARFLSRCSYYRPPAAPARAGWGLDGIL